MILMDLPVPKTENPIIQASWNEWKTGLSILWKAIPETVAGRTIIPLGITRSWDTEYLLIKLLTLISAFWG